jgi:hypothetical protein
LPWVLFVTRWCVAITVVFLGVVLV